LSFDSPYNILLAWFPTLKLEPRLGLSEPRNMSHEHTCPHSEPSWERQAATKERKRRSGHWVVFLAWLTMPRFIPKHCCHWLPVSGAFVPKKRTLHCSQCRTCSALRKSSEEPAQATAAELVSAGSIIPTANLSKHCFDPRLGLPGP
jgi:hypothetical protein